MICNDGDSCTYDDCRVINDVTGESGCVNTPVDCDVTLMPAPSTPATLTLPMNKAMAVSTLQRLAMMEILAQTMFATKFNMVKKAVDSHKEIALKSLLLLVFKFPTNVWLQFAMVLQVAHSSILMMHMISAMNVMEMDSPVFWAKNK